MAVKRRTPDALRELLADMMESTLGRDRPQPPNPKQVGQKQRFDEITHAWVHGCRLALRARSDEELSLLLNEVDAKVRGFAVEGVALSLAVLDASEPGVELRWPAFLQSAGAHYGEGVCLGLGWAHSRLATRVPTHLNELSPLLGWMVVDGYGCGYALRYVRSEGGLHDQAPPNDVAGYAARVFDQGLGRCIWYIERFQVKGVLRVITELAAARHGDLWTGIGRACSYGGGVDRASLKALERHAGPYRSYLAAGVAHAAWARLREDISSPYTQLACEVLWGLSPAATAAIASAAWSDTAPSGPDDMHEQWLGRIRTRYAEVAP